MMEVLSPIRSLVKLLGIDRSDNSWKFSFLRTAVIFECFSFLLLVSIPMPLYAFSESASAIDAMDLVAPVAGFILGLGQYVFIIFNRSSLNDLFDELQAIVNDRIRQSGKIYCKKESKIKHFFIRLVQTEFSISLSVAAMPLFIATYHCCMGTYSFDVWILPYKVM